MGGKGSADQSGMYMAMASAQAAQEAYALGEQQFQWSQQVWQQEQPLMDAAEQAQISLSTQEAASLAQMQDEAQQQWATYLQTYLPLEQQYVSQVENWASPQAIAQARGQAMADVAEQGQAGINTAAEQLRAYGVNPSSPRYASLFTSAQPMLGAAEAAAGTTTAQNLRLQQMGLEAGAINTGRGMVNTTGSLTQAGTGAGAAGAGAASGAGQTALGNLGGTAVGAGATSNLFNAGSNAMNTYVNAVNGYNQAQAEFAQAGASEMSGFGSVLGSLTGLAFLKSDVRDKTDIKREGADPRTGIPLYSYRYKEDPKTYPKVVGPIAQDIEKIAPELVRAIPGSPGTKMIALADGGPTVEGGGVQMGALPARPTNMNRALPSQAVVDKWQKRMDWVQSPEGQAAIARGRQAIGQPPPTPEQLQDAMNRRIGAQPSNAGMLPSQPYMTRNLPPTPVNMNARPMNPPPMVGRPPVGLQGAEEQMMLGREGLAPPVAERRGGPIGYDFGGDVGSDPQLTPDQGGGATGIPSQPIPPAQTPPGDATPGGGVPANASPSLGVETDDVPAMLTANEFVIPKDVAVWKGHEYFAKQIDLARRAQQQFSQRGDIGGEPTNAPPQRPAFVSRPSNMGTTRGAIPGLA